MSTSEEAPKTSDEQQDETVDEPAQATTAGVGPDRSPDGSVEIREDVVQRLLKGFHESQGIAAVGDFIGAEFHKDRDRPTQQERGEAYRRYVDDLAEKGLPESSDDEQ